MKVSKQRFIEAMAYIREINQSKLEDLDLSDFEYVSTEKDIKEFKFMGLCNRDFIKYWVLHEKIN
jgi:hypothetical protein